MKKVELQDLSEMIDVTETAQKLLKSKVQLDPRNPTRVCITQDTGCPNTKTLTSSCPKGNSFFSECLEIKKLYFTFTVQSYK